MKDIQFNAILDKNDIARTLGQWREELNAIHFPIEYILVRLEGIEEYTGEANQPNVRDSYTDKGLEPPEGVL